MTTNCVTKLDYALIRPARIDHQIQFALARHEQIRKIFEHIYDADQGTKSTSELIYAEIHRQLVKCDNVASDLCAYMPTVVTMQPRKIKEPAEIICTNIF
jgi:ATP-dependent 26S proteasome regulatory subunit